MNKHNMVVRYKSTTTALLLLLSICVLNLLDIGECVLIPSNGGISGGGGGPAAAFRILYKSTTSPLPELKLLGQRIHQKCYKHTRWLSTYANWHADSLAFQHEQPSKYLQFRCNHYCGGHGDRLLGIISTFVLAVLTNRTFLITVTQPTDFRNLFSAGAINWMASPFPENHDPGVNWIDWRNADAVADFDYYHLLATPTSAATVSIRLNSDLVPIMFEGIAPYDDTWHPNTHRFNPFLVSQMKLKGIPFDENLQGCIYHALFRPSYAVRRRIQQTIQHHYVHPTPYIGIHIRVGGNSRNGFRDLERSGTGVWHKVWSAAIQMENRMNLNRNGTLWYVASDDLLTMDTAKQIRGNRVFFIYQRPVHTDLFLNNNIDTQRGAVNVIADWYLLASANALVMSHSQFSLTARHYGLYDSRPTMYWSHE
jgi:hypothetical protein